MTTSTKNQGTITAFLQDAYLLTWVDAFLLDRRAQNLSRGTVEFYRKKLKYFNDYCEGQAVKEITQIDAVLFRQFLLTLEAQGHNAGGIHAAYRTVKTFLRWWEREVEPENWKNPVGKVRAPKVGLEPLEPVDIEAVTAMIDTCQRGTLMGERDRAFMLFLLDTGIRAGELVAINLNELNPITGEVLIRKGKGRKPRTAFLGAKARKAVRAYLQQRRDTSTALWISRTGERLTYWGLTMIMRRRAARAGVHPPELHAFRRWFALTCLRAGIDAYSLQELMGHADLQIMRRYLKQTHQDFREAHHRASPVDNLKAP